jgi:hypothetical protein
VVSLTVSPAVRSAYASERRYSKRSNTSMNASRGMSSCSGSQEDFREVVVHRRVKAARRALSGTSLSSTTSAGATSVRSGTLRLKRTISTFAEDVGEHVEAISRD